jgi:histidyl-tRNA synthetase
MNMASIEPTLPGGFRDYLSNEMYLRQQMIDSIRTTFGSFGFSQIDTPGVERAEVLTGGDPEFKKQMYHVSHQEGESGDLALRFD